MSDTSTTDDNLPNGDPNAQLERPRVRRGMAGQQNKKRPAQQSTSASKTAQVERRRLQARERMARRRAEMKTQPFEVQAEWSARQRAYQATYREQRRPLLRDREHIRRQQKKDAQRAEILAKMVHTETPEQFQHAAPPSPPFAKISSQAREYCVARNSKNSTHCEEPEGLPTNSPCRAASFPRTVSPVAESTPPPLPVIPSSCHAPQAQHPVPKLHGSTHAEDPRGLLAGSPCRAKILRFSPIVQLPPGLWPYLSPIPPMTQSERVNRFSPHSSTDGYSRVASLELRRPHERAMRVVSTPSVRLHLAATPQPHTRLSQLHAAHHKYDSAPAQFSYPAPPPPPSH
ncbi:hypothetical protein B0H11DRAFT_2083708 [Mycena galericulata]|nr:hypothetical protein B0H11DRAFT_2083708 [Mycena galericulata]